MVFEGETNGRAHLKLVSQDGSHLPEPLPPPDSQPDNPTIDSLLEKLRTALSAIPMGRAHEEDPYSLILRGAPDTSPDGMKNFATLEIYPPGLPGHSLDDLTIRYRYGIAEATLHYVSSIGLEEGQIIIHSSDGLAEGNLVVSSSGSAHFEIEATPEARRRYMITYSMESPSPLAS